MRPASRLTCPRLLTPWLVLCLLLGMLLPVVPAMVAQASEQATISAGKADYAPDEVVDLFGRGWEPNEVIQLAIDDDEGKTWRHRAVVTADESGAFEYEFQLPSWFVATYTVVANGAQSGIRTTSFTDDIARGEAAFNSNGIGTTASSQITINAPAVSPGDLLLAQITIAKDFTASTTICPPSGWVSLSRVDFELKIIQQIFVYVASASQPNTSYTWSFKTSPSACNTASGNRSQTGASGGIIRYSGVNTSAPIEAFASASGNSSGPYRAPSVTTSSANARVLRFFSAFKNTNITGSSRIYWVGETNNGAERSAAAFDNVQAVPGPTGTFNATFASSGEWLAHTLVLRPAPLAATRLAFITLQRSGVVNQCLGPLSVQTQNANDVATGVMAATTIDLASSDSGAFFSDASCATTITRLSLNTGASTASFYYRPSARGTGSHALTASATGLTSASQSALVARASQAPLSVTSPTDGVFGDRLSPSTAGGSGSGAVSFDVVSGSSACALLTSGPDAGKLAITSGTGSCQLTATRAGDNDYTSISSAPFSVAIGKAAQSISFAADTPSSKTTADPPFTVSALASSGLPVSFAAEPGSSCAVSSVGLVSALSVGACTIIASQPGNANFNPAPPTFWQIVIGRPPRVAQTITFDQPATPATFGSSFLVTPEASSNLPVRLAATGACGVALAGNGYQVTMTSGTGSCILTASQDGDDRYLEAADVVRVVEADRAQASVTATGGSFVYTGTPRAANGVAIGLGGIELGPVTLSYQQGNSDLAGPPSDAGSYTLRVSYVGDANYAPGEASATLTILPRSVEGSFTASDKRYDSTTAATISSRALQGVLTGDDLELTDGVASFADKSVGMDKVVIATGFILAGADADNYRLVDSSLTSSASITARPLRLSATGIDKVYDATTGAQVTLNDDRVAGDALSISYLSASFDDRHVGIGKTVRVEGIRLDGGDAGNYTLDTTILATTASIEPKQISGSFTAADKIYDGTSDATISSRTLAGLLGDDVVILNGAARFADKQVGQDKLVTGTGFSLSGGDAGNYVLTESSLTSVATIRPRPLALRATGVDKAYDGTTNALVILTDDRVAGDMLSISYTSASFIDFGIGTTKPVIVSGIAVSGPDLGNYLVSTTMLETNASITPNLYRARQVGSRVHIERNIAVAGIGDFDGDPVDGWAMVGRTNGASDDGQLRGFFVRDSIPYAIVFNRNNNVGNRCILLTPVSLSVVRKGQTRLVTNVNNNYVPCPPTSSAVLP
jgi:hypothetical protein